MQSARSPGRCRQSGRRDRRTARTEGQREITIANLTSKQRAHLRRLAHHLDAILQVGADGATDAVLEAVEDAFSNRELIKVKVLKGSADDPESAAARVAGLEDVHVVQVIGRTLVLYRPHPESPEIRLPG